MFLARPSFVRNRPSPIPFKYLATYRWVMRCNASCPDLLRLRHLTRWGRLWDKLGAGGLAADSSTRSEWASEWVDCNLSVFVCVDVCSCVLLVVLIVISFKLIIWWLFFLTLFYSSLNFMLRSINRFINIVCDLWHFESLYHRDPMLYLRVKVTQTENGKQVEWLLTWWKFDNGAEIILVLVNNPVTKIRLQCSH